jgi:hypothetical protein
MVQMAVITRYGLLWIVRSCVIVMSKLKAASAGAC